MQRMKSSSSTLASLALATENRQSRQARMSSSSVGASCAAGPPAAFEVVTRVAPRVPGPRNWQKDQRLLRAQNVLLYPSHPPTRRSHTPGGGPPSEAFRALGKSVTGGDCGVKRKPRMGGRRTTALSAVGTAPRPAIAIVLLRVGSKQPALSPTPRAHPHGIQIEIPESNSFGDNTYRIGYLCAARNQSTRTNDHPGCSDQAGTKIQLPNRPQTRTVHGEGPRL